MSVGGHEIEDVVLTATGVEARAPWSTDRARLDGLVTFATVAAVLSEQLGADVELSPAPDYPGSALLTTSVLGLGVGAVVEPAVRDATTVEVQVSAVSLGGATIDVGSLPGGLGSGLTRLAFPLDLPDGVALESVRVAAGGFRIALSAHRVALADLAS